MVDGLTADNALAIIILGALLPPLLGFVYASRLDSNGKALATVGVSVLLGIANSWLLGEVTRDSVVISSAGIWLVASGSHEFFWKPVGWPNPGAGPNAPPNDVGGGVDTPGSR